MVQDGDSVTVEDCSLPLQLKLNDFELTTSFENPSKFNIWNDRTFFRYRINEYGILITVTALNRNCKS